jgi:Glycosyltransferase family 87
MGRAVFPTKRYVRLALLGALSVLLFQQLQKSTSIRTWPVDDFVEYWAAARLQLAAMNPYSPDELFHLQKAVGWSESNPVMMWNPPWALALVLPFGAFDYSMARSLWFFFHLAVLFVCVAAGQRIYEIQRPKQRLVWGLALSFFPFVFVLKAGQITALVLLGITGFLFFERRREDGFAGAFAALTMLKPHLLYLFWIALFFWTLKHHRWRIAGTAAAALFGAVLVVLPFNLRVVSQYFEATMSYPPLDWATPTLGGVLRMMLGTERVWLQFLPSIGGCVWLSFYYRQQSSSWTWREQTPLLLLVSVLTASYGAWTYDQVVLLLVLFASVQRVDPDASQTRQMFLVSLFLAANVTAFVMNLRGVNEIWFFWMAPVWLGLYWAASNGKTSVWSQSTG